jgi:hypothetical protein
MTTDQLVTILILCFIVIPLGMILSYVSLTTSLGSAVAKRLFPKELATEVVVLLLLLVVNAAITYSQETILIATFLIITLWLVGNIVVSTLRRSHAGTVLLDMGLPHRLPLWLIASAIAFGGLLIIAAFALPPLRTVGLLMGLLVITVVIQQLTRNKARTIWTDTGLYAGSMIYKWQQIKRYMWLPGKGNQDILLIYIKGRLPPFDIHAISISPEHKAMVSKLLTRYVRDELSVQNAPGKQRRAADPPSCRSWASVLTVGDRVGGGRLTPRSLGG